MGSGLAWVEFFTEPEGVAVKRRFAAWRSSAVSGSGPGRGAFMMATGWRGATMSTVTQAILPACSHQERLAAMALSQNYQRRFIQRQEVQRQNGQLRDDPQWYG